MKKQHSTEKAKKNSRPVSEKFYQSINERAIAAANVVGKPLLGVDIMMAVDAYINDNVQPSGHSGEIMLIFVLLKPEIDKAMARSAAARNRRKRCASTPTIVTEPRSTAISNDVVSMAVEEEPCADAITASHPAPGPEGEAEPCIFVGNRRERRRQEQEQRRLAKRLQRRR
ncbi:MAG: hypothetical protein NC212_07865 [Staphylococcus sp.]|nr:hypothetical protein [Staphylococcus sp.]